MGLCVSAPTSKPNRRRSWHAAAAALVCVAALTGGNAWRRSLRVALIVQEIEDAGGGRLAAEWPVGVEDFQDEDGLRSPLLVFDVALPGHDNVKGPGDRLAFGGGCGVRPL